MEQPVFPTDYPSILAGMDRVHPVQYARTRNFTNGAVTCLSPYISRGVISTRQVLDSVLENGYTVKESMRLIQELAWREYFQRIWQHLEDDMFEDIRIRYKGTTNKLIPRAVAAGKTGIDSVDDAIARLYQQGYMHNHLRMYTASIVSNIARSHWLAPAQWMYYHLLDGDLASNTCNWQWVAGTFSSRPYYCNQENINKYAGSQQRGTFLDHSYQTISDMDVPEVLRDLVQPSLVTALPEYDPPKLNTDIPLLIYTHYNLDPLWRKEIPANRVLLLEPSHFRQFPVSDKVIQFILELARNIEGLSVFTGEINELPGIHACPAIYSKEHPAFRHLPGTKDPRDWIFPEVTGFHDSFFRYWKKCERLLPAKKATQQTLQFT